MRDKNSIGYIAIVVFIVVGVCFYLYISEIGRLMEYASLYEKGALEKTGLLGDSAGLINALFSGLAFGGVILTIIWQIKNDNRSKINAQRLQFENTFFNMTQTFEHIVEGLVVEKNDIQGGDTGTLFLNYYSSEISTEQGDSTGTEIKGRAVFKYIYQQRKLEGKLLRDAIVESGLAPYEIALKGILDHYFRYLYRILKFIDETDLIDAEQKYRYASMFRAQLSEFELVLIYYNGVSQMGCEKLKPLLEKYSVLKNIRLEDLATTVDYEGKELILFREKYSDSAFKHVNIFVGGWIMVLLNVAFNSIILILLLTLVSEGLDDFIFRDILSQPVFKEHSLAITLLLIVVVLYLFAQSVDYCNHIQIKKREYLRLWDTFRYLLTYYYDAANLKMIVPVILSFFYLCGSHDWFGYGFVLYVNLIILCLLVRPMVALGYTCYQMYKLK